MSIHKLSAGSVYDYLTRQVARHDATATGHAGLANYYSAKGEAPGAAGRHRRAACARDGGRPGLTHAARSPDVAGRSRHRPGPGAARGGGVS